MALSPDGRHLVFVGLTGKTIRLYRRALDSFEIVPLAGTENAANPFFSPDGRWVGFVADGKLKKLSLEGGAPVTRWPACARRAAKPGSPTTRFC